jgi:hypothetical protein
MSVTINGSTGISGVDGSASTPAYQGGDSDTGVFFPAADTIAFAEGGAEVARFDDSGRLLVGVTSATANGGVLELSGGITFPATAVAATNPNTLDDYEEGTFTPAIIGTSTAGTGTYSQQLGVYTKIGRQVFFTITITWSAHTGTGNIGASGLPFTSANTSYIQLFTTAADNLTTAASSILGSSATANTADVTLFTFPVGGGSSAAISIDTAATLYITGAYHV